jgi:hypothetical protein
MDVLRAADDVRSRTLAGVRDPIERLIYLGSMRDYNTGIYHHAGLALRFSDDVACEALAACHREAYRQLLESSLNSVVEQLDRYAKNSGTAPEEFIANWRGLEPYRVAVPADTDPLSTDFLCSNLSIALSILESRLPVRSTQAPGAWPHPSPAQ